MSTEVLLMTDVSDLGSEGEVVKVSDGYARNYLLPRKLAAPVTDATRRQLDKMREQREAERKESLDAARRLASEIEKVSCTITVKATGENQLYGSVTSVEILSALAEQGVNLDKSQLLLDEPLKELGVYSVKVSLHPEVESTVKVWVVEE